MINFEYHKSFKLHHNQLEKLKHIKKTSRAPLYQTFRSDLKGQILILRGQKIISISAQELGAWYEFSRNVISTRQLTFDKSAHALQTC